ncbi:MAG: ABC transporter permease [Deltaproteobacteria bacterium]|nr:ABC transporter permease [Deltaproteobacteria bacterium]
MDKAKKFFFLGYESSLMILIDLMDFIGGSFNLFYASFLALFRRPFYFKLLIEQCYILGVKSSSIVFITALSTGMVMSLQFGFGLERFGGKLYVPKVVGLSIMRELGPVLSCLMIAARVGAGIAAEIGSMNVTQQIDAIRALGTDPIKRLVIPRVLALLIMTPLLTVFADLVGIFGGMFISNAELFIHPDFYYHEAILSLKTSDFLVGILKTSFFGLVIALTGCYYGMNTQGGTQGVGQSTTKSVVTSSLLIVVSDFVMTKLFWIFERK